jgi:hypothetical protein
MSHPFCHRATPYRANTGPTAPLSVLLFKVTLHYDIGMNGTMNNDVAVLHNDLSGNHCALR